MMKKVVFLFVCLFAMQTIARADNDKPIQVSQMPKESQQFIKQHFSESKIAMAKVENDLLDKSYTVIFTSGDKVEFNKKGAWKEVDCKHSAVPVKIIPAAILKNVKTNYPDTKILKIDRDKKDYEITLSNKLEIKFDLKFNVISMDN